MVRVTARPSPEDVAAAVALPPLANSAAIGSSWLEHFAAPREDLLSVLISEALQYPEASHASAVHDQLHCALHSPPASTEPPAFMVPLSGTSLA